MTSFLDDDAAMAVAAPAAATAVPAAAVFRFLLRTLKRLEEGATTWSERSCATLALDTSLMRGEAEVLAVLTGLPVGRRSLLLVLAVEGIYCRCCVRFSSCGKNKELWQFTKSHLPWALSAAWTKMTMTRHSRTTHFIHRGGNWKCRIFPQFVSGSFVGKKRSGLGEILIMQYE